MRTLFSLLASLSVISVVLCSASSKKGKKKGRRKQQPIPVPETTPVRATPIVEESQAVRASVIQRSKIAEKIRELKIDLQHSAEEMAQEVCKSEKQKEQIKRRIQEAKEIAADDMAVLRLVSVLENDPRSNPKAVINQFTRVFTDSFQWIKERGKGGHQLAKVDGQTTVYSSDTRKHHFDEMFRQMRVVFKDKMGIDPQGYADAQHSHQQAILDELFVELQRVQSEWSVKIQELKDSHRLTQKIIQDETSELNNMDEECEVRMQVLQDKVRDGESHYLAIHELPLIIEGKYESILKRAKNWANPKHSKGVRKSMLNALMDELESWEIPAECSTSFIPASFLRNADEKQAYWKLLWQGNYGSFECQMNEQMNQMVSYHTSEFRCEGGGSTSYHFSLDHDLGRSKRAVCAVKVLQRHMDGMNDGSIRYWKWRSEQVGKNGLIHLVPSLLWAHDHWAKDLIFHLSFQNSYELLMALLRYQLAPNRHVDCPMTEGEKYEINCRVDLEYNHDLLQKVMKSISDRKGEFTEHTAKQWVKCRNNLVEIPVPERGGFFLGLQV